MHNHITTTDIRIYIHKFSNLTITACTGCLHSTNYEIISIVDFSFHSFIDADRIMAKCMILLDFR